MMKRVQSDFNPAWWVRGAHLQTIFGALCRTQPVPAYTRERIETPDGDFLDLDYSAKPAVMETASGPLIVMLHGLEGSSRSPYILSLIEAVHQRGRHAVVMNMRMCSGVPNRLLLTYHSGKSEDLDSVVRYLKEKFPSRPLALAGFSIGGNIILKWLGEKGEEAKKWVRTAAAVSVPYDLMLAVKQLDRGVPRYLYSPLLIRSLKKKVLEKKKRFPDALPYERLKNCRTFRVFDREFTAPLNGFRDETDYWTRSSCRHVLSGVRVPALLIHAQDDPFYPGDLLPGGIFETSSHLRPCISRYGGHLGFLTGTGSPWLENRILDFLTGS